MIAKTLENLKVAGIEVRVEVVLADAGYSSESNFSAVMEPGDPELIVATQKDWKERQESSKMTAPRGRIPSHLSATEKMERKLKTKRGKALYKKRAQTVEPVFGQIKGCQRSDTFMRRGTKACDSEWKLICLAHSVLKLWHHACYKVKKAIEAVVEQKNLVLAWG